MSDLIVNRRTFLKVLGGSLVAVAVAPTDVIRQWTTQPMKYALYEITVPGLETGFYRFIRPNMTVLYEYGMREGGLFRWVSLPGSEFVFGDDGLGIVGPSGVTDYSAYWQVISTGECFNTTRHGRTVETNPVSSKILGSWLGNC